MRKLIKKILKEDEYDFIRNVKPTINKGTYLCDRYGTKWINMSETEFNGSELVASDTDYTVNNKFIWLIRTHDYGKQIVRRTPSPWKIEDVLQQLSDGSLTICDNPSSLKESDDLEWIKDVKSNQDIAQEIADETKIKDNEIYPPFPFNFPPSYPFSLPRFPYLPPFFTKYCEEQYGLSEERLGTQYINDINDVWKRYKKLVKGKVNDHNNLNENDDMQWIRDVEPYVSFEYAEFYTKYGITIEDDYVFYNSIEDCGEEIDIDSIDHVKVSNRAKLKFWEVYCSIGPGVVEWQGYKECLQIEFYDKHNRFLLSHWFAPDDIIQLHII